MNCLHARVNAERIMSSGSMPHQASGMCGRMVQSWSVTPVLKRQLMGSAVVLARTAAREFQSFMEYAGKIWNAAAPHFVYGPAVSWSRVLTMGPSKWKDLIHIDGLRTMESAVHRRVSSPYLRDVLLRYATYNGSDPRKAPATINCIAHVEMAMGGFGIKGGIYTLVEALEALAVRGKCGFNTTHECERLMYQAEQ